MAPDGADRDPLSFTKLFTTLFTTTVEVPLPPPGTSHGTGALIYPAEAKDIGVAIPLNVTDVLASEVESGMVAEIAVAAARAPTKMATKMATRLPCVTEWPWHKSRNSRCRPVRRKGARTIGEAA